MRQRADVDSTLGAIVIAAGFSSRMGALKPLLSVAGRTMLSRCVELFRKAGVTPLVVTGHAAEQVGAAAAGLGASVIHNPKYSEGMLSSIQAGFAALPSRVEAAFLLPADIPLVRPSTIDRLLTVWRNTTDSRAICIPHFHDEPGHPPLIGAAHFADILKYDGSFGMQGYLQNVDTTAVPTADAFILLDMDTPRALADGDARARRNAIPTASEAEALLKLAVDEGYANRGVVAHCRAVAAGVERLATALRHAGLALDVEAVTASALLHDVCRLHPQYAAASATYVEAAGFTAVAPWIASHLKHEAIHHAAITEAEVIYLVDTIISNASFSASTWRNDLMRAAETSATEPAAFNGAEQDVALRLLERMEAFLERSILAIVRGG